MKKAKESWLGEMAGAWEKELKNRTTTEWNKNMGPTEGYHNELL